jgi:hypothetical protein
MSPPRGADKIVLDLEVMSSVPTCCLPTKKLPVRTLILVTPITVEGGIDIYGLDRKWRSSPVQKYLPEPLA